MHLCRCCCVTVSVSCLVRSKRFWRILQKRFTRGTGPVFGRCQGITRSEIVRLRGFCVGLSCRSPGGGVRVLIGANAFGEFSKSKTPPCPQAWFSRAFAAACRRSRRAAPPGLHGKRLCFRCIVATRRSSSVRCFAMVRNVSLQGRPAGRLAMSRRYAPLCAAMRRFGVTHRTGSRWHGMTRRECAASRHLLRSVE